MPNKILGMTIAVQQMESTLAFYTQLFDLHFEAVEQYGSTLYQAQWSGLQILLCPAALAQNTAKQNRHQLDLEVENIEAKVALVEQWGGTLMGPIAEANGIRQVGIYDPDRNSLVLKERLDQ